LAQLFAEKASRMPAPVDSSLLDPSWHHWRILDELAVADFHTGRLASAAAINEQLLAGGRVPEAHQARIRENLGYCRAELAKHDRDVDAGETALPVWMHEVEARQVLEALASVSPARILEWGAGGSTRLFLQRLEGLRHLHSIEHDAAWCELVDRAISDTRLDLHHVPANEAPPPGTIHDAAVWEWASRAERDPAMMRDYVARARSLGGEFDAVFVDGRARSFCIREGFELLRPGGVLVLHDAQRLEYHEALRAVGRPEFLPGWVQGQVCVLRKASA
jgi:predicted O-methyltransferase YrrM